VQQGKLVPFASYQFVLFFLPAVLAGFYLVWRLGGRRAALGWLAAASLAFCCWDAPAHLLPPILASVAANYLLGVLLARPLPGLWRKLVLAAGVTGNVAFLGYYKYADFIAENLGLGRLGQIALPLGISFYTFQQIAYLVDVYRAAARPCDALRYALFITFFAKLTAGPIVLHGQMLPQLMSDDFGRPRASNFSVGLTILVIGMVKKVAIADQFGPTADAVFGAAAGGAVPTFADAWLAALAYTLQIYFDFSGYSDMAIGLGRLVGIRLPLNFASPYKATSIVEFWRRWHMTLSRFLRDYLYIPLGGNRKGKLRRYVNLMVTMLLGGLWHGAGWTFVAWGGLHGAYLCANHGWRALRHRGARDPKTAPPTTAGRAAGWAVTFLAVMAAWVFFRAADFASAGRMLSAMAGLHGLDFATTLKNASPTLLCLCLLAWVLLAPNTQQWMASFKPAFAAEEGPGAAEMPRKFRWRPVPAVACVLAVAAAYVLMKLGGTSSFIYWQF
jgi:D-alanyl-lipoteichoic acid acyltransferase DltB (MBOAT superfamily)